MDVCVVCRRLMQFLLPHLKGIAVCDGVTRWGHLTPKQIHANEYTAQPHGVTKNGVKVSANK